MEDIPTPKQRCFIESVIRALKSIPVVALSPVTLQQEEVRVTVRWKGRPVEVGWDENGPFDPESEAYVACGELTRIDPCPLDCNSTIMICGDGTVMVRQVRIFQVRDKEGYK